MVCDSRKSITFAAKITELLTDSGKIWLLATTKKNAKTANYPSNLSQHLSVFPLR